MRVSGSLPVPRSQDLGFLACLVAGLPIGFDVELIGRVTGTEIAILILLPLIVTTGRLPPIPGRIRTLLILSLVWLTAQIVSDLVNESPFDNMVRGLARAGITAVLLLGFFALIGRSLARLRMLFGTIAVGLIIGAYFNPIPFAEGDAWKFGYGIGVTMLIVTGACTLWSLRLRLGAVGLCLGVALLNLLLGFRSMAGIVFLDALLLGLSMVLSTSLRTLSSLKIVLALLTLVAGGVGVIEAYAFAAQSGLLGTVEQERFIRQVDDRGVLLSGRSELPVAIEAVIEKPLLGHGSWAVSEYYATLYWDQSYTPEYMPTDEPDFIPTHSHLMGAWVEGGIFAALFWLYTIALAGQAIIATLRTGDRIDPIIMFILVNLSWSIMFSPYGLVNRVLSAFAIVAAATVLQMSAGAKKTAGWRAGEPSFREDGGR